MDLLSLQIFNQLIHYKSDLSLSIYLPTLKAGREIQQNPVRFKNLLSQAESMLEEKGLGRKGRDEFLDSAWNLQGNREFWQNQEKGLVVFLSENLFRTFRLPLDFDQRIILDRRFHVKPLLPLFLENERFYLLALSRKDLKLYAATRFDLEEIPLKNTPTSLEEALKFDDPERELQYQAGAAGSTGDGVIFHGHHPENDQKDNLVRYFHMVDQGVMAAIGNRSDPLVLAGLDYLQPLYRQVNSYSGLLEEGVYGNVDQADLAQLHHKAWEIVQEKGDISLKKEIDRYHALKDSKKSSSLREILPAAYHGRVERLFVDLQLAVWGQYNAEQDMLQYLQQEDPKSRDLIDLAVIHTLLNGGSVQNLSEKDLEGLTQSGLAAILRY
jgi:hypothetical protein